MHFYFTVLSVLLFCQQSIQFEHKMSWQEALNKARSENKYVFVDCFATWCRPCTYMMDSVFTKQETGDFFNARFVNVKVQMDQTEKDDERVKNWYAQAKTLEEQYDVDAYPCFLFINPDGELIYKITGACEPSEFIRIGSKALDECEQYFFLLEEYNRGKSEPTFIKQLLLAAEKQGDKDLLAKLKAIWKPRL
jgi:thioredoxin-related protein